MITVIDIGISNVRSVANALEFLELSFRISSDPKEVEKSNKMIFPGVGNYGVAVKKMEETGIDEAIKNALKKNSYFLGICLGMQLLFEESKEAEEAKGLGLFKGRVEKLKLKRVPNIGWNEVNLEKNELFKGLDEKEMFYFAHSYACVPMKKEIVIGKTENGIVGAVQKNNVFGVQFHPEKSSEKGLKILKNYGELK